MKDSNDKLKVLARNFYQIQKHRIAFGNQIRDFGFKNSSVIVDFYDRLFELEKDIEKIIKKDVQKVEIWNEYLKKVRGIGPILTAALISLIDIERAEYPSSLWKLAGLTPTSERRRGKKLGYNPDLKKLCWKIGRSLLMINKHYKKIYDERKKYEEEKHPELRKVIIHNRSRRYMVKMFLKDLYLNWRSLAGLPVSKPYVIEKLGHKYKPQLDLKV